jgi:hydrogenase maturation protease
MDPFHFDTVVVGVSNAVLSGDGVGVHAARALMRDPRLCLGIAILDGGMLGLELLERIADAHHILFLDEVHSGVAPGTVVRIAGEDLLEPTSERSVHQVGIADLLAALALVSSTNTEVVVLGMRPPNAKWRASPWRAARMALAPLVNAALDQLRTWQEAPSSAATQKRAFHETHFGLSPV